MATRRKLFEEKKPFANEKNPKMHLSFQKSSNPWVILLTPPQSSRTFSSYFYDITATVFSTIRPERFLAAATDIIHDQTLNVLLGAYHGFR